MTQKYKRHIPNFIRRFNLQISINITPCQNNLGQTMGNVCHFSFQNLTQWKPISPKKKTKHFIKRPGTQFIYLHHCGNSDKLVFVFVKIGMISLFAAFSFLSPDSSGI